MKCLVAISLIVLSISAFADGFVCQSQDGGSLSVKVYNQTDPNMGTRNEAVMVLSDSSVSYGNKTIATFKAFRTLSREGHAYIANVDLRYNGSDRKGEYIMGTRLGNIDQISIIFDFSYSTPVANGEELEGIIEVTKRNGESSSDYLNCKRYLKN